MISALRNKACVQAYAKGAHVDEIPYNRSPASNVRLNLGVIFL